MSPPWAGDMAGPGRARGRVGTWPAAGIPAPWLSPFPAVAGPVAARLREWAAAEVAPGRLMPWVPVAFGAGIVLYFVADREPVWWVAAAVATAALTVAFRLRASPAGFPVAVGCAALLTGFATAATKSRLMDHVILLTPAYSVSVSGFVEAREERERSDRIVVRVVSVEAARLADHPERIRVTVRKGAAPAVGALISLKARLNPPASPFRPGGYDLARDLYFQKITINKINNLESTFLRLRASTFGSRSIQDVDGSKSVLALIGVPTVALHHLRGHADHVADLRNGRARPTKPHDGGPTQPVHDKAGCSQWVQPFTGAVPLITQLWTGEGVAIFFQQNKARPTLPRFNDAEQLPGERHPYLKPGFLLTDIDPEATVYLLQI